MRGQPLLSTLAAFHRIHALANGFMHVQDSAGLARLSKAIHQWVLDVRQSDYGYVWHSTACQILYLWFV